MKLWLDDIKPAPKDFVWCKSVDEAKEIILAQERIYADAFRAGTHDTSILARFISLDHDAGEYKKFGGDYICLLEWLEKTHRINMVFHIHSKNLIGKMRLRKLIKRNHWEELK